MRHDIGALLAHAEEISVATTAVFFSGADLFIGICPPVNTWDSFERRPPSSNFLLACEFVRRPRAGEAFIISQCTQSRNTADSPLRYAARDFLPGHQTSPKEMLRSSTSLSSVSVDESLARGADTLSSSPAVPPPSRIIFDSNPELDSGSRPQASQNCSTLCAVVCRAGSWCTFASQPRAVSGHARALPSPVFGDAPFMLHLAAI